MATFEQALEQYVRERVGETDRELSQFCIEHEEGWSNDSGTSWPASTVIKYRERWEGRTGQRHNRLKEVYVPALDVPDLITKLFEAGQRYDEREAQDGT